ncbi:MAG: tRNA threonylcarbamoyladenosine dehydratase [Bacillota bacterium]|nr:tRNA threonylcarbamoyladenosine dehydratase [Bacillota bacterium]
MFDYPDVFLRGEALLGQEGLKKLAAAQVLLCGVGGVGSYVAEALVRSGLGAIRIVDFDQVAPSNINRQLCALHSTIGLDKAEVTAARLADINPGCRIQIEKSFIDADNAAALMEGVDYVADAIDYLPGKLALALNAKEKSIPFLSAMGAGRRLDPSQLRVEDISRTHICPLARNFRRELRSRGLDRGVEVVFSLEHPLPPVSTVAGEKAPIGSLSFVPGAMGLLMASVIVRRLAGLA